MKSVIAECLMMNIDLNMEYKQIPVWRIVTDT